MIDENKTDENILIKSLEEILKKSIPQIDIIRWDTIGVHLRNRKVIGLGLNNCNLRNIPKIVTKFKFLKVLYLTNNQLTILPEFFSNLITLEELYLNHNQLTILPESFGNLQALQKLFLHNNQLKTLPTSFSDLQALQILNLRNNQLSMFPVSLLKLRALKILSLGNNKIMILPESVGSLQSLQKFHLKNNTLIALPKSLLSLQNLTHINIDKNPLDKQSKNIYKTLKKRADPISYQLKIKSRISLEANEFIEGFYRTKFGFDEGEYGYLVLTTYRILYYRQKVFACLNWIPLYETFELVYSTNLEYIARISMGGWRNKYISINNRKHILHKVDNKALSNKLKKMIMAKKSEENAI